LVWWRKGQLTPILEVRDLRVRIQGPTGLFTVVDRLNYAVLPGQVFGIAGESGSGKTLSTLALIGLAPSQAVVDGSAWFDGDDLLALSPRRLRDIRGRKVAMIFQDPMTALHPMMTIERQLTEHARQHLKLTRGDARDRAVELLREVQIPDPVRALRAYPHQFSGGMRQRIGIAMALICGPQILIADEPTTALDVTVQAGVLRLLDRLRERYKLTVILITHDLGVMSSIADELSIFYAGRIIERGPAREILQRPRHPYTAGLIRSLPHPEEARDSPHVSISGTAPNAQHLPTGCAFHPRCTYALASCAVKVPDLAPIDGSDSHKLACPIDPLRQAT
jgi:oligopeptide/dipeptide ABC transporter ATP-binding protein